MGWWELSIVGVMMILVLGPKELPHAMKTMARLMRKARRLASEFQGHMDDIVREADLDDVRKTVTSIKNKDVGSVLTQAVDPTGELTRDLDNTLADARKEVSEIKSAAGPSPTANPVAPTPPTTPAPAQKPEIAAPKTEISATRPVKETPATAGSAS